MTHLSTGR